MKAESILKIDKSSTLLQPNLPEVKPRTYASDDIKVKQFLATIESIATGTPRNIVQQCDAASLVANLPDFEQNRSRIDKLYRATQINTRHLAINLLSDEVVAFSRQQGNIQSRMEMYKEHGVPLAERVTRKALLSAADGIKGTKENICDAIRLIVFVSSTGFIAPGVDTELIDSLGLRRDIARVTVNFMGCAAAMNGMRVACDHVRANPTHKALVVCLELSSINAVFEDELNDTIIHSLFGDGCAAVVFGAIEEEQASSHGKVVIRDHLSYLVENTEDGITLGVKNNGITCRLSRQLPDYIETGVGPVVERFLANNELSRDSIDLWAVHPGGPRIIEKAQRSLGLTDSQVAISWEILRQYGNMLSSSVLFVMERMLFGNQNSDFQEVTEKAKALTGIAFSFSPGVGIEGILFQEV